MKLKKTAAAILTAALLLSGCGTGSQGGGSTGEDVGILRIGTTTTGETLTIMSESGVFGQMNYISFSAAPFVELDKDGFVQPYIMTSWEISEDQKTITASFAVDKGITWHDGKPLTIEDIIFTFDYLINVKKSSYLQSMTGVEQIDEKTLRLNFAQPDAFDVMNSIVLATWVYPKHIWEGIEDFNGYTGEDRYIGCGPYKLVEYDLDAQVFTYEAVESYFKGELTVKKVVVRSYESQAALAMALVNGEVDAMYAYSNPIDPSLKSVIADKEGLDLGSTINPGHFQIAFGFRKYPTNDLSFRKAVASALDYELLAVTIGGEDGEVAGSGVISPTAKGYNEKLKLPMNKQNIEEAKKLLDQAGFIDIDNDGYRELPNGEQMSVLVTPQFNQARSALYLRICEIIIENMKTVGVRVVLDEQSVRNSQHQSTFSRSGEYEIRICYNATSKAVWGTPFWFMADGSIWGTCDDEEFMDAYNKLMSSPNYEVYLENCADLQRIVSEKSIGIALCWDAAFYPYRTDKYGGWINYPGWGGVNPSTWYSLYTK